MIVLRSIRQKMMKIQKRRLCHFSYFTAFFKRTDKMLLSPGYHFGRLVAMLALLKLARVRLPPSARVDNYLRTFV